MDRITGAPARVRAAVSESEETFQRFENLHIEMKIFKNLGEMGKFSLKEHVKSD